MNFPIPSAVETLRSSFGIDAQRVTRADLGRDGKVWLEVGGEAQSRWFCSGEQLTEAFPVDDKRVPLCARLDFQSEDLQVLSWRPERRIAIRMQTGSNFEVIKGLRTRNLEKTHAAYCKVFDALTTDDDFIVPKAELAPDLVAVRLSGLDLDPVFLSNKSEFTYELVGSAIASFQRRVPTHGLARHDFAQELAVLDTLSQRHQRGMGSLPSGWLALRQRLNELCPADESGFVAAHRDLHDGQLLTDGDRVGLLDFDLLTSASPLLDLANLSVHLMLRALQQEVREAQRVAEDCGRALLVGYGLGNMTGQRLELRTYQTTTFLRLALVYSMRPKWRSLTSLLIRYAELCLDEPRPV